VVYIDDPNYKPNKTLVEKSIIFLNLLILFTTLHFYKLLHNGFVNFNKYN